jgi:putative transposase
VYVLVGRWRAGEGVVSDLLPSRSGGGRLPGQVEAVISEVLSTRYLTRQRRTVAVVHREIARCCRTRGLPVPSRGSVARRIARLEPVSARAAREGSRAVRALGPGGGVGPEITGLLERAQIDHTPVDVIVVDERHRLPIGRPYLTIAVDEASRCVLGTVVTLEAPSTTSVGLCLAHAAIDKRPWLERLGVQALWPMCGKPRELFPDNAAEFKSEALRRGCEQHGIALNYRPRGLAHFGVVVLDWQHPSYRCRPHRVRGEEPPDATWPIEVHPDGDYYIWLAEDLRYGTFGHPWEPGLCIFGEEPLAAFAEIGDEALGRILRRDGRPTHFLAAGPEPTGA